jgi:hypothetical protein
MPKGSYVPTFQHAARLPKSNPVPQYRLNMSLIRISDNEELWHSWHEY